VWRNRIIHTDVNGVSRREEIHVLGGSMPRQIFQTPCESGDSLNCCIHEHGNEIRLASPAIRRQVEANIPGNPLNLGAGSPHKLHGVTLQKKIIFMSTNEIK